MSEKPTPRTNKERFTLSAYKGWLVHAEFAEELEQENQELRDQLAERDAQLAEARTALELIADSHDAPQNDEYAREALARIDANRPAHPPTVGCGEGSNHTEL